MRKTLFENLFKPPLTEPGPRPDEPEIAELAAKLGDAARARLGRSLSIRQVDFYDLERFGLRFVASPRHADVLLVTGPVTKNMREALLRTFDATPSPKWVVAAGACALDGGVFAGSYACVGGVSAVIPVDLHIPGCPPTPMALLAGLLALLSASVSVRGRKF